MSADAMKLSQNKKKFVLVTFMVLIFISVLIFAGYFYKQQRTTASQRESLTAVGTVEATTVMAAFKVPGKIDTQFVEEGSEVEKGQQLAILDSREIVAKLAQARGAQQAAIGQKDQAQGAIPLTEQTIEAAVQQAQSMVEKAQVGVRNAEQNLQRVEQLYEKGAASASQYDQTKNAYDVALNDLQAAEGQLNEALSARHKVAVAHSQYEAALGQLSQAEGAVLEAEAYMENTILTSPIAGFITQKFLEPGEMVNAGTPVFEISDLKHTYVKVYIDETKIGRVKLNQTAQVKIAAFPDKVFTGKVVWISDAGDFAVHKAVNEQYSHDIRSFEVKIDIPNPDLLLKTGLTAVVTIEEEKGK